MATACRVPPVDWRNSTSSAASAMHPIPGMLVAIVVAKADLHPSWSSAQVVDDVLSRWHRANGGEARPKRAGSVVGAIF